MIRQMVPSVVELCRGLLRYSEPGHAIPVPHAALAELVEMAAVQLIAPAQAPVSMPTLHDVAMLARRYNRSNATVRQWFHDGLFGPPKERLFRGRGYVASDEVVRTFERRTGLTPVAGEPALLEAQADVSACVRGQASNSATPADPVTALAPATPRKRARRATSASSAGRPGGESADRPRIGDSIRALADNRRVA